ncbi:MAG: C-GCAxxG-C-C family protein [Candidatus Thorarchaeota archaeon]|jgi:C_GCAxxG_C_C family probable redox protein
MPTKLSEAAKKMMQDQKGHCCQAVFTTYAGQFGPGKVDFDTCMKIASAFSGGVNRTGNVCGAITGALMALGLKYGGSKQEVDVTEASTKLLDDFKSLHGTTICRELIQHDLITDEDVKHAFETNAFKNCSKYVEDVAIILEEFI